MPGGGGDVGRQHVERVLRRLEQALVLEHWEVGREAADVIVALLPAFVEREAELLVRLQRNRNLEGAALRCLAVDRDGGAGRGPAEDLSGEPSQRTV